MDALDYSNARSDANCAGVISVPFAKTNVPSHLIAKALERAELFAPLPIIKA